MYDSNLVTYEILMCYIMSHTHIHTHVHTGRPSSASSHASSSRMQDNLDTESCSSHDSTGNYLHMLLIYLAPILGSKFSMDYNTFLTTLFLSNLCTMYYKLSKGKREEDDLAM